MNRFSNFPLEQRFLDTRQAFESVAAQYDGPLGNNLLVQHMRIALQRTLQEMVPSGKRLLDLGCGTGLDAAYFALRGYVVTAIDSAPAMLSKARQRADRAGIGDQVHTQILDIQALHRLAGQTFSAIYSNLGALNCLPDLEATARNCARLLEPGGLLIFSVIGRICPWELAYYGMHGDFARAWVRFAKSQVPVSLNERTVWTRYYTPGELYQPFAPRFKRRTCQALNLFLPPPYLVQLLERHPWMQKPLAWLDEHAGRLPAFNLAGDHFLIVMALRD
jgi:SAM-dependent methyltransferase